MPSALLSVPHFEQSRDGACLPACVRMVLAYWGEQRSENSLARQLGTKRFGTPISNASRLQKFGYQAGVESLTRTELEAYLTQGQPVIVRVWTAMFDYWTVPTSHVVVVVGFDENVVYLNDPAFSAAPQNVSWGAFQAAWAEYDETAVIIARQ